MCVAALAILAFVDRTAESSSLEADSVQIVGSETMRPVVAACAEEFMSRHPLADIVVKGGGSGDGIAALLHGITDIGMSSRELSVREQEYAASKGIELAMFALALDGITIIVNPANPLGAFDLAQLRNIFAGAVRNWREIGGAAEPIVVVARAPGSGTATLFGDRVMGGRPVRSICAAVANERGDRRGGGVTAWGDRL